MIEQRSEEWFAQRCGKITASRFVDAIAMSKRKPTESTEARDKYMRELAFERMSGNPKHSIESKSLAWGETMESMARQAFEMETGELVAPAEFMIHPEYDFIGGSPDGLVGDDGIIEIKCPHDEAVHVDTWLEGMPAKHMPQVQGNLFVTGRQWCAFISFDPRQKPSHQLYWQRVERDEDYIKALRDGLIQFNKELLEMIAIIERKAA